MRKFASLLPSRVKLTLLKRHLAISIGGDRRTRPTVAVLDQASGRGPLQVSLHKDDFGIGVGLDIEAATNGPFIYRLYYARLPAVLCILSQSSTKIRMVTADLGDRGDPPPGGLAFCSCRDDVILIPDPVFFNSDGYAKFRSSGVLPWSERRDVVLWRGTSTGIGEVTTDTMQADDPCLRQRVRMCLMLRSTPGTDVKIRKTEGGTFLVDRDRLVCHGLLSGKIRASGMGPIQIRD